MFCNVYEGASGCSSNDAWLTEVMFIIGLVGCGHGPESVETVDVLLFASSLVEL